MCILYLLITYSNEKLNNDTWYIYKIVIKKIYYELKTYFKIN